MESNFFIDRRHVISLKEFFHRSRAWIFYVVMMTAFTIFGVTAADIHNNNLHASTIARLDTVSAQLDSIQKSLPLNSTIRENLNQIQVSMAALTASVATMQELLNEEKGKMKGQ